LAEAPKRPFPFTPEQTERVFRDFDDEKTLHRIDISETVLPVAARAPGTNNFSRPDFFGTAFAVAPDIFLTAAHVWHAAAAHGEPCICGSISGNPLGAAFVDRFELHDGIDIAIIKTKTKPKVIILRNWFDGRLQLLSDVGTFGYPHAITFDHDKQDRWNFLFRAFKGYVIATRENDRLAERPAAYEVSVPFPLGLSGAPILVTRGNQMLVAGVVLGIAEIHYGGERERPGIGLPSDVLLPRHSDLLGGKFGEALQLNRFSLRRSQ
jgi:hypothetical protein